MKDYNPFGGVSSTREHAGENEVFEAGQTNMFGGKSGQGPASYGAGQGPASYGAGQSQFPQFQDASPMQGLSDLEKKIDAAKSNGWGGQLAILLARHGKKIGFIFAVAILITGGLSLYNSGGKGNMPILNITAISGELTEGNKSNENLQDDAFSAQEFDFQLNDLSSIVQENGSLITKTAMSGDGITHLARRAIKNYLEESGKTLNDEQKIYAEDYVQNRIGSEYLEVGQKLSFSEDLLQDAIENAESLGGWEIENLSQYTLNVSLL